MKTIENPLWKGSQDETDVQQVSQKVVYFFYSS